MIKNILITGGTGFVGTELSKNLQEQGYNVSLLSRKKELNNKNSYFWDIEKGIIDPKAIENNDAIIHLAGENISSKRWTAEQKQKIVDSRTQSTSILVNAIETSMNKPKIFISASAIGYYGYSEQDVIFTEEDKSGNDFLAQTVSRWEESLKPLEKSNIRIIKLRIGVVMSKKGGALVKMMLPLKFGFISPIGSGKQYVPWISLTDLCRLFLYSIENNQIEGIYNAVSSKAITNKELTKSLAKNNKGIFLPINVPSFILKLIFGEMASILLLGNRVSNQKILHSGFTIIHHDFEEFYK